MNISEQLRIFLNTKLFLLHFCALHELTVLTVVSITCCFKVSQLLMNAQQKLMVGMNSSVGQQSPEVCDMRRWGYQTLWWLRGFPC